MANIACSKAETVSIVLSISMKECSFTLLTLTHSLIFVTTLTSHFVRPGNLHPTTRVTLSTHTCRSRGQVKTSTKEISWSLSCSVTLCR
ncbi:hypothetical protein GQ55_2G185900 [Panicum hallii var. hallii]|uniref:Uncharacterized protein n=1 Tax=Panicum hallii var. hallii TaxID=1504633 RepID=A0A2T7EQC6_9POAL|nr:hypothetical protein GQ55_2G185900 [Panicum hallii var. hallii]